ncbi:MAG: winged helix-turn-helix transcriptional regulator [Clostridia bacterium]|nr:winged helix-turn-helix transcriptional regulator [Clostridia bacterium]
MKDLTVLLKALGDPTRLEIYRRLLERRHCVRSLSRSLGITESAVSQHLKILREAGLVAGEKYGRHTHYLPCAETLTFLSGAFSDMRAAADALESTPGICRCAYRRKEEK